MRTTGILIALAALSANAQAQDCLELDFEGLPGLLPVGTLGTFPAATFTGFFALIDVDAGGSGFTANEPSGDTTVFPAAASPSIDFSVPVGIVEMWYSADQAHLPVGVAAWDGPGGTGSIVATVFGHTVGRASQGANCTGDPTGDFCHWDLLVIDTGVNNIRSLTFANPIANNVAFDDMRFCVFPPGNGYCAPANPNSTGVPGELKASGSSSVLDNLLTLNATNLPTQQFGMIVNSMTQGMVQPPGSDGVLCLGGQVGRHKAQLGSTGPSGTLSVPIDLTALPTPLGPYAVQAGETWNFQAWHRDVGGTSNFTSGWNVTFH